MKSYYFDPRFWYEVWTQFKQTVAFELLQEIFAGVAVVTLLAYMDVPNWVYVLSAGLLATWHFLIGFAAGRRYKEPEEEKTP